MVKKLIHIIFVVSVLICVAACEEPMDSGVWNEMEEVMQTGLPVVEISTPNKATIQKDVWLGNNELTITSSQGEELYHTSGA